MKFLKSFEAFIFWGDGIEQLGLAITGDVEVGIHDLVLFFLNSKSYDFRYFIVAGCTGQKEEVS